MKILEPHVFDVALPTVRIEPEKPTIGQISFQAGDQMVSLVMSRVDLERLARLIDEAARASPIHGQPH